MSIRNNMSHQWSIEQSRAVWHKWHVENKNKKEIAAEMDARLGQIEGQIGLLSRAYEFFKSGIFNEISDEA